MGAVGENKKCSDCGIDKPLVDFTPRADRNGTPRAQCKRCISGYRKSRYSSFEDTRAAYRASGRKFRTGVSQEDFNQMFEHQNGCCAICKRHQSESKRTFSVDHDHKTGLIRGLLCNECNLFLGLAYDSTSILASAIEYLKQKDSTETEKDV